MQTVSASGKSWPADGQRISTSRMERAMRRRGLLQPIDYTGERRELANALEPAPVIKSRL